ncbi:MAG TPA: hypothetical protein VL092_04505 [Chitinophagaceae bacterium]|nr:hypothetical protein [Chitinophagaceae bacterium]
MGAIIGSFTECYRMIKTARQKKRLVKNDFDKQLIRLHKSRKSLLEIKQKLPMVPVEHPYQKGWKRTFELRKDVAESKHADFYLSLLDKINTVQYSRIKYFQLKRRKHRKKVWIEMPQTLQEFDLWKWERNIPGFSEQEKAFFYPKEYWCTTLKQVIVKYAFTEPWRFILKIKPNMITHQKMIDETLDQEIAFLDQHIANHFLQHKIIKLVNGHSYKWRKKPGMNTKHKTNYLNELLQE